MALKYTCEIDINKPRSTVVELIDNPDNMVHWQPGFISMETIEGELGADGSKSLLKYKMGKRDIEMVETIIKRDFPDEFSATYEAKGVYNKQVNTFYEVDENTTKWVSETYFELKGFIMIMGWLMPGSFKKQSMTYLKLFKEFAEKQD